MSQLIFDGMYLSSMTPSYHQAWMDALSYLHDLAVQIASAKKFTVHVDYFRSYIQHLSNLNQNLTKETRGKHECHSTSKVCVYETLYSYTYLYILYVLKYWVIMKVPVQSCQNVTKQKTILFKKIVINITYYVDNMHVI